jgi:hypothetical protein
MILMPDRTREQHLQWCKEIALQYATVGDNVQAVMSMANNMRKHEETKDHSAIELMMMLFFSGNLSSRE